ncbi:hypothetical protein [Legionella jordanis]|uniref:Phasin protein n=1 Tax=Legionella jordanis TaxID=456 RepID=A0A0W0VGR8_9GAMM|nr:hypothetical protein [Legionella jordanis]KTD19243.1 hypothetical protein Ljor_0040 [Legionella jordanis]RMW99821.1 phasin family protein [Legionella jordanis]RMX18774.1 phasin family protein [Legionella jordanis]VEH12871.1 Uncharacterised protein [Legionella jordanis]HAT8714875.1 phasin family protein [Legionella jordanis]
MQRDYLEGLKDSFNQLQKPLQELVELNVKTFQNLSYIKPEDLSQLKNPEDLLEKNVNIFIQNSHRSLDYLQQAFHIFEKHLLSFAHEIKKTEQRH